MLSDKRLRKIFRPTALPLHEVDQMRIARAIAIEAAEEMRGRITVTVRRLGEQTMDRASCVLLLHAISAIPVHKGNEVNDDSE